MKCENCEREVQEVDFVIEENLCTECAEYLKDIQEGRDKVQVTRDMAIDAGNRSLEGQWIEW